MQVSVEVSTEETQYVESSSHTQEKSACDILAEKLRTEFEDEQQAIKELDDFLEPTITALRNGVVSDKTAEEIVKETLEEIAREKNNGV